MSNSKLYQLLEQRMSRKQFLGFGVVTVASLFGVAGIIRAISSAATIVAVSAEPEKGTLSNGASVVADSGASNGQAVEFNAPVVVTPPTDTFVLGVTMPTATNTGAGVNGTSITGQPSTRTMPTTVYNGDLTLTGTQNAVNLIVHGRIICKGSGYISNCVVDGGPAYTANSSWVINTNSATAQTIIEFTTIKVANPTPWVGNIGNRNFYAYRCDISQGVDLFDVNAKTVTTAANVKIYGCYGHDMARFAPDTANNNREETHNDWIQISGGSGFDLFGNNMQAFHSTSVGTLPIPKPDIQLSAIMLTPDVAQITNVVIRNNWIAGGQYAINGGDSKITAGVITVTNNIFFYNTTGYGTQLVNTSQKYGPGVPTDAIMLHSTLTANVSGNTYTDGVVVNKRNA